MAKAQARLLAVMIISLMMSLAPVSARAAERAYELVTPVDKGNAEASYSSASKTTATGDRLFFETEEAIPGSASNPGARLGYVAQRTSTGWSTTAISPVMAASQGGFSNSPFKMFDTDLTRGVLQHFQPEFVPGGDPESIDLYRRSTFGPSYELITTQHPITPLGGEARPDFSWASSDLTHVLFSTLSNDSSQPLMYFPGVAKAAYYSVGGLVSVASVMPGSTDPFPDGAPGVGLPIGLARRSPGNGGTYRAISENGSRIIFTVPSSTEIVPPAGAQLYLRKDHGTPAAETVHVSAPEAGVIDPDGTQWGLFRGASVDGSTVFFTSCQKLTSDSTADHDDDDPDTPDDADGRCVRIDFGVKEDLYVYDANANGGAGDLIDITSADPEGAVVLAVIGVSEDGSRAYFVAQGELDPAALRGEPNLYLWEEDGSPNGRIEFIATLMPDDFEVWEPLTWDKPEAVTTPDGSSLAFTSSAQLTTVDNGGRRAVYLYNVDQPGQLECASCTDTLQATLADATLKPQGSQSDIQPAASPDLIKQNLTDDGSKVFFETKAALAARDINQRVDVYEYDRSAGISLISSGRSEGDSGLHGSSPDGSDVFFTTRERLVGWDVDTLRDIYDARVGGGFPEPELGGSACELDCQGASAGVPSLLEPSSALLQGLGNIGALGESALVLRRLTGRQEARLAHGHRVTLQAEVSGSGMLRAAIRARWGGRTRTAGKGARRVRAAGQVRVVLGLSRSAQRRLERDGKLRVAIVVSFAGDRDRLTATLERRGVQCARCRRAGTGG